MSLDKPQILVIDDESTVLELLQAVLVDFGYAVTLAGSGPEGIEVYKDKKVDLILLDLGLPGVDGLEVIRQLKQQDEDVKAIAMTGTASIESAVQAMRVGAVDFLSKPLDLEHLRIVLSRALEKKRQHEKVRELEGQVGSGQSFEGMIGTSPAMQEVFSMIRRVAATNATVLIRGESGTGKELVARALHALAYATPKPFYTIDCASIPANLMETELFGHERGAFTDAKEQKKGLLELADGGTLFLDEIGLMPLDLQAKLLNVFETLQFRRVGGTRQLKVSVRFLVATNEDLEEAVKEGRFREDLYYRLNVVPIHLPPLRERGEDVALLAEYYLQLYSSLHGLPQRQLAKEARVFLRAYPWMGNVRELRNVIERAVLMTDAEVIRAEDLAIDRRSRRQSRGGGSGLTIDESGKLTVTAFPAQGISLEEVEKQLIQEALRHAGGNISRAATLLSTSRDVMRYRIAKYDLNQKQQSSR